MRYRAIASLSLLLATAACSTGTGTPTGAAQPQGWTKSTTAASTWAKPGSPGETFSSTTKPFDGTTKDLASQITLDAVLKHHAKLERTVAFPPCPGEAGLQTYRVPPSTLMLVAYAVYGDKEITATYSRPQNAAEDPAAMDALRKSVCTG